MRVGAYVKRKRKQLFPEKRDSNGRNSVFEKKWNLWMLPILAVTLIVTFASVFAKDFLKECFISALVMINVPAEQLMDTMREDRSFLGTSVMTLFSVLAAFLVFYYGSLGYTNYGLSNRKIIGYTIGSYFLPFLVMADAYTIVWMVCGYYIRNCVLLYVSASYACLLLAVLVILSVYSTSKSRCFKAIQKAERKQYASICRSLAAVDGSNQVTDSGDAAQMDNPDLAYLLEEERNINKTVYHSRIILESEAMSIS